MVDQKKLTVGAKEGTFETEIEILPLSIEPALGFTILTVREDGAFRAASHEPWP